MTAPHYDYWHNQRFVDQGSIQSMNNQTSSSVIMLTTADCNRITHQHVHLKSNQALTYVNNKGHNGKIRVANHTYEAKELGHFAQYFNPDHSVFTPIFIIVNKIPNKMAMVTVTTFDYYLNGNIKRRTSFETDLQSKLKVNNLNFTRKATITSLLKGLYGGLVFVGISISLALAVTTTIVIYFKQISEGYADHERFHTMQQVGLSEQETVKSIHSQVLMVFLMPVIGAIINLCFAIPAIRQIMIQLNFYNLPLMLTVIAVVAGALLIAYLLLYGLTTSTYRQIVDRPMKII